MSEPDEYKTIKTKSAGLYKNKGSKFLSFAYPVTSEDEIDVLLKHIKNEFHDARHHCYAYVLGVEKEKYRANDDGEPWGTAGRPILGQLYSKDITNVLLVVVRYFGGTLLGTGGLITAYKSAAKDAIDNVQIIKKTIDTQVEVSFNYEDMNQVMRILNDDEVSILSRDFQLSCRMIFTIRKGKMQDFIDRINMLKAASCKVIVGKKNIN